jgi:ABC-type transport system substrate-binding protein
VDWRTTDFLVGTGPFKLKSVTSGVSAEFVKNPDYFKKDSAGRQLPYLDGVIYTVIDVKSAIDAFVAKRFDQTYFNLGIPDEEALNRIKTQAPDTIVTERAVSPGPFVFFNQKVDAFKDIRVRQAMALLVDQKELAVASMGGVNWGVYNTFIFAPTWDLPAGEVEKGFGWNQTMDARVAQAKKLMADAGYSSGFKAKLLFWTVPMMQKWTQVLSDVWKRHLNIDVTLDPRSIPDARALIAKGDWEFCVETLVGQVVGDPDESIPFFTTGGRLNTYKYSNPKVDELFKQQSVEMDVAKRKQLTLDIGRTVMADMALIPMLGAMQRMGQYPYVKGYKDQGYGSPMAYEYVWLDK